ncbi:hypothetical protein [Lewinella cohaerens]|uniref:hypothetical protein n=1 Tax=Lewinella cohaerens TaxID=70995 RepID=UPI0003688265|nr:hypothetical protein [Lewinella cohaerens]
MTIREQAVIIEQINKWEYWVKTDDGSIKKLRISGKQAIYHRNLPVGLKLTIVNNPYSTEEVRMADSNRF